MKVVLQRVTSARVVHHDEVRSEIKRGCLLFVGIETSDSRESVEAIARRIGDLRVFEGLHRDERLTIGEVKGEFLVLHQSMLCGEPTSDTTVDSDFKSEMLDWFCAALSAFRPTHCGRYAGPAKVQINNEGPATYLIEG